MFGKACSPFRRWGFQREAAQLGQLLLGGDPETRSTRIDLRLATNTATWGGYRFRQGSGLVASQHVSSYIGSYGRTISWTIPFLLRGED